MAAIVPVPTWSRSNYEPAACHFSAMSPNFVPSLWSIALSGYICGMINAAAHSADMARSGFRRMAVHWRRGPVDDQMVSGGHRQLDHRFACRSELGRVAGPDDKASSVQLCRQELLATHGASVSHCCPQPQREPDLAAADIKTSTS